MSDSTELRDEELAAIGRIAIRDALLNQLVEYITWSLIDPADDNVGATITKPMNFARVTDLLRDLVAMRVADRERRGRLLAWTKKVRWAHKERNSLVHSALVRLNPDEERLTHFRIVPGEEEAMLLVESFNAASLDYLANAMTEIAAEGLELFPESEAKLIAPHSDELPTEDDRV